VSILGLLCHRAAMPKGGPRGRAWVCATPTVWQGAPEGLAGRPAARGDPSLKDRSDFRRLGVRRPSSVRFTYDRNVGCVTRHVKSGEGKLCLFARIAKAKKITPAVDSAGVSSGAEGSRTLDLCSAIAALSQLSYRPGALRILG
jgi:hypothetical protein